jgi:anti-anti-sigma factor
VTRRTNRGSCLDQFAVTPASSHSVADAPPRSLNVSIPTTNPSLDEAARRLPFSTSVSVSADAMIVRVVGDVDERHLGCLQSVLDTVPGAGITDVHVDLSDVTFLGSRALGMLAAAHDDLAERGCRLVITSASPAVKRLIGLAGAVGMLPAGLWTAERAATA